MEFPWFNHEVEFPEYGFKKAKMCERDIIIIRFWNKRRVECAIVKISGYKIYSQCKFVKYISDVSICIHTHTHIQLYIYSSNKKKFSSSSKFN